MDLFGFFTLFFKSMPLLLKGAKMTLYVFSVSSSLALTSGLLMGILRSEFCRIKVISRLVDSLTFVFRAVPFYVQLMMVYFVLPELLGINFEPFTASVIALGLCSCGYISQIVRAGINCIDDSQFKAAYVLGYSKVQTMRYVILPQLWPRILPPLNNEFESLLKSTAIVSTIGLVELTRMGMNIITKELQPIPIYMMVATFYVLASLIFNRIAEQLNRRFLCSN